ncbi:MAG: M48 family metallopeptidase [Desulfamplus sp.]|nr:M48 family metallopeptidase [Desulfamplus sp.]
MSSALSNHSGKSIFYDKAVKYGEHEIKYTHIINNDLKHSYINVDPSKGVTLKTPFADESKADEIICKKGKWILQKLKAVERVPKADKIVTGSRLQYLGKTYYALVKYDSEIKGASALFTPSKFIISLNPNTPDHNHAINKALEIFSKEQAVIKIRPRIDKWIQTTGITPSSVHFKKLKKSWGRCTKDNEIIINYESIKLPFSLIDYIIVHELAHIRHKDHSKNFYREVSKFITGWQELDEKIRGMII